jgi:hypothetical protein
VSRIKTGNKCPKCGGNLYMDRDYNGWYEQCLMCSYMKDLVVVYQKGTRIETGLKEAIIEQPEITKEK